MLLASYSEAPSGACSHAPPLVLLQGFDETLLQELAGPLAYGDCELACRTHKPERRTQPHIA